MSFSRCVKQTTTTTTAAAAAAAAAAATTTTTTAAALLLLLLDYCPAYKRLQLYDICIRTTAAAA